MLVVGRRRERGRPRGLQAEYGELPSGACTIDGEKCQMGAVRVRTCPLGEISTCSYTGYQCQCENGSWRCYAGPRGSSACMCKVPDGGMSL